ncbi:hypothetical protein JG688_00004736 [Phytophthora aleatoria]|uniref:Uncharacterized protein n=1 Tax=Phytophthora aleatoria TaxID=2496075 RepID=A0A8J5IQM9_9STRA|nr:hypothetical protein JG688_00004736 [Phytophthora aleatoria]
MWRASRGSLQTRHRLASMPKVVMKGITTTNMTPELLVTPDDKMPLDVDACVAKFGAQHGKASIQDHLSELNDTTLKLACLRRGVSVENMQSRCGFVDALWRSCIERVNALRLR